MSLRGLSLSTVLLLDAAIWALLVALGFHPLAAGAAVGLLALTAYGLWKKHIGESSV